MTRHFEPSSQQQSMAIDHVLANAWQHHYCQLPPDESQINRSRAKFVGAIYASTALRAGLRPPLHTPGKWLTGDIRTLYPPFMATREANAIRVGAASRWGRRNPIVMRRHDTATHPLQPAPQCALMRNPSPYILAPVQAFMRDDANMTPLLSWIAGSPQSDSPAAARTHARLRLQTHTIAGNRRNPRSRRQP